MNYPDVTLKCTKSHLYHVVFISTCNVFFIIFTTRCYASSVLAMALCPSVRLSVCPSVCPSHVGVLIKRLNVGSHKQHRTIAQGFQFSTGITPCGGTKCRWDVSKSATFNKQLAISRKQYKIDAWFLLKSNRTSYALYRMVALPVTVSAP